MYRSDPNSIDDARLKLAEAVLAVTRDDSRDAQQLARLAIEMLRLSS